MGTINVSNCPACHSAKVKRHLVDWQNNKYAVCHDCGSWYIHEKEPYVYEENYWGTVTDPDGNVRDLTKERDFKIKNWYGDTVKYVNTLPAGKILDIGAGLGFFLSGINSDWEKYALEVSEEGSKFIQQNVPSAKILNCYLEDDTFEENMFDVVMFYHVIEHVEDPHHLLKNIRRILKPGGLLICGTPNISSWIAKRFDTNYRLTGKEHICLFSEKALARCLKQHDLKVTKREYPYWKTDYATFENLKRLWDTSKLSPPFMGSVMTYYCRLEKNA